jgi:methionyl-tRNA formyltransferase
MSRLRLAFMGTPDFAVPALAALLDAGHELAAVYSQPPRPAGRGQRLMPSAVQAFAETRALLVRTPKRLRDAEEERSFAALALDAAVVAAYGLILPPGILSAPRLGCVNIHASLLPRWRGAAPIERAILAGDRETGITIMQMDEGLDTGGILLQERIQIAPEMDAGGLREALSALGARLIVTALDGLALGRLTAGPQPADGVTYAAKIEKGETRLDWRRPAETLARQVRAFAPAPGAWFALGEERVRVLSVDIVTAGRDATPGTALDDRLAIACGIGALRLRAVQRASSRPMAADAFLRGRAVPAGTLLP